MLRDGTSGGDGYQIIKLEEVQDYQLVDLLSGSLSTEGATTKSTEFWNWKHTCNPFGVSFGVAAISDEDQTLIGVRPLMRWNFNSSSGAKVVQAVRPVDTVTHPSWRGKGIFRRLTLKALSDLDSSMIQLAFNTPNQNSMPGYLKLGWKRVSQLKIYVAVNKITPFYIRMLGRKAETLNNFSWVKLSRSATRSSTHFSDSEIHEVLDWCAKTEARRCCLGLRTERSEAFLKWRYTQQPNVDYGFTVTRNKQGEILSVVVLRLELRSGLLGTLIQDVFVKDLSVRTVRAAIRSVRRDLNVAFLAAHFKSGSVEHKGLLSTGFFPIKKVALAARPIIDAPDTDSVLPFTTQWDLTLADVEVF